MLGLVFQCRLRDVLACGLTRNWTVSLLPSLNNLITPVWTFTTCPWIHKVYSLVSTELRSEKKYSVCFLTSWDQMHLPVCLSSDLMDLKSLPANSFHFHSFDAVLLLLSICIYFSRCSKLSLRLACITAYTCRSSEILVTRNNLKDYSNI